MHHEDVVELQREFDKLTKEYKISRFPYTLKTYKKFREFEVSSDQVDNYFLRQFAEEFEDGSI